MATSSDETDERTAEKNDCFREVFQTMHITEEDYAKYPYLTQLVNQQVSKLLKYRDRQKTAAARKTLLSAKSYDEFIELSDELRFSMFGEL